MFRTVVSRLLIGGVMLVVLSGWAARTAAPVHAAPSAPAGSGAVTVSGEGLAEPLTVTAKDNSDQFEALLAEVDFLASGPGIAASPKADKLGPKYAVVVLFNGVAKQQYDLYPLASGGPRAFRPATQPDRRKVSAAWFYGRLTMPASMRQAGIPLADGQANRPVGGGGGGAVQTSKAAAADVDQVMGEWRQVVALNGAIVIIIAIGLFGIAFLIRRKV
jgi:hypothetical protein